MPRSRGQLGDCRLVERASVARDRFNACADLALPAREQRRQHAWLRKQCGTWRKDSAAKPIIERGAAQHSERDPHVEWIHDPTWELVKHCV